MSGDTSARVERIVVLKLGSSVLRRAGDYAAAARSVARRIVDGRRAVAVVSAPGGTTDALLRHARQVATRLDDGDLARLLSKGEEASAALLCIALREIGLRARAVERSELGLRTTGSLLEGDPEAVDTGALLHSLAAVDVLVVPGFVGTAACGRPSLLGRGGSDYTALFLAHTLRAEECHLIKDVAGLLPDRPIRDTTHPPAYACASWDELLLRGGELVQERAVRFAMRNRLTFRVGSLEGPGTRIGPDGGPA